MVHKFRIVLDGDVIAVFVSQFSEGYVIYFDNEGVWDKFGGDFMNYF